MYICTCSFCYLYAFLYHPFPFCIATTFNSNPPPSKKIVFCSSCYLLPKGNLTKPTSKSWTIQRNLRCDHSNESSLWVLSNGGVYTVAEQSSCFCNCFALLNRKTCSKIPFKEYNVICYINYTIMCREED